jgi:acyl-coenzyme A thioesterase PaaI-like protein
MENAIQSFYPDEFNYCYGCGQLNEHGLKIKSYEEGGEVIAVFNPQPYHIAVPGYVYGGLIASLIDCHGIATSAAAASNISKTNKAERFVTASLQIDFIEPTPLGVQLELRGKAVEFKGRKVISEVNLFAEGKLCVKGKVIAVQIANDKFSSNKNAP